MVFTKVPFSLDMPAALSTQASAIPDHLYLYQMPSILKGPRPNAVFMSQRNGNGAVPPQHHPPFGLVPVKNRH